MAYCDDLDDEEQRYNVVTVTLTVPFDAERLHRNFFATSSCGVCGKASLDDITVRCAVVPMGFSMAADVVVALPERLRAAQRVFDRTGGLHAAGLFTAAGESIAVREDVGRHNAVDKVIGEQLLADRLPLADVAMQVSGRVSFEIVQKAAVAGIPVLSAVGAPSSLAVEAGERLGVTVLGFVRDGRCNVYSHAGRDRLRARLAARRSSHRSRTCPRRGPARTGCCRLTATHTSSSGNSAQSTARTPARTNPTSSPFAVSTRRPSTRSP